MYMYCTLRALASCSIESFLERSVAGHVGGARVHHGAHQGPGRVPWRILWAFIVARAGSV